MFSTVFSLFIELNELLVSSIPDLTKKNVLDPGIILKMFGKTYFEYGGKNAFLHEFWDLKNCKIDLVTDPI